MSFAGSPVRDTEPPGIHVAVAEAVRSDLVARMRVVRPLCPDHRTGTHPKAVSDRAVWWCTPGAQASEPVC
jgi:hypothetical protein